ncbi:MAG: hypothetical protein Kow00109_13030 [Acidobacteriota bacterium]
MFQRCSTIAWLASLLFAAGLAQRTQPPDHARTPAQPAGGTSGWTLLFDGNTLNGWEDPALESPPGRAWDVQDHCIHAAPLPCLREDLYSLPTYGDFELVFDWKIAPGANSGVKYLIQDRIVLLEDDPATAGLTFVQRVNFEFPRRRFSRRGLQPGQCIEEYTVGFEYQIIDNERHPDAAAGADRRAGALYGLAPVTADAARPAGEFNEGRIVLRGNHVEHWLNGVRVVVVDLTSPEARQRLAGRWGTDSPVYRLLTELPRRRTPIALQHHNDEVWFRNIRIRRLD